MNKNWYFTIQYVWEKAKFIWLAGAKNNHYEGTAEVLTFYKEIKWIKYNKDYTFVLVIFSFDFNKTSFFRSFRS